MNRSQLVPSTVAEGMCLLTREQSISKVGKVLCRVVAGMLLFASAAPGRHTHARDILLRMAVGSNVRHVSLPAVVFRAVCS